LSRGPWLGAFVGALTIAALGRGSKRGVFKGAVVVAVIVLTFLNTPYGDSLVQYLPFVGTAESDSVIYRQRLLELSLTLIADNPFFGTPGFIQYMESLRQGQGIIDLVNGHMTIALSFGLVGLSLYLGVFGVVIWRCAIRPSSPRDEHWRHVGVGIGAAIVTAMVTLFTASNYLSVTYLYWALAGLGCGLMRLPLAETAVVRPAETAAAGTPRGPGRGYAARNRSKWAAGAR
jgi:O-antigen ligase